MLTITIDPLVLTTLQQSFPTPRTAAARALNKYKVLLEDLLFHNWRLKSQLPFLLHFV